MSDIGERVIEKLYRLSSIDEKWSVRRARGYTWWGGHLAQHVWADGATRCSGVPVARVHAQTDFISGFRETEHHLNVAAFLAQVGTLSGLVHDPADPSKLRLAAAVSVHEQDEDFLTELLAWAAAIQVAEAHFMSAALAMVPEWKAASSGHPVSGPRTDLHKVLDVVAQLVAPLGREESTWRGAEMEQALRHVSEPPCVLATGDAVGLAAEFPFPDGTSLIQLTTEEVHPRLGHGCLCRLSLPLGVADAGMAALALDLNGLELSRHSHFIGSWCPFGQDMTFVSFLPNAMSRRPGRLVNVLDSLVARATWVSQDVFGYDVNENFERALEWKAAVLNELVDALPRTGGTTRRTLLA